MQRRDRGIAQSLGLPLTKKIKDSRVLLVGAGGIGCEVLKNLVCCGFGTSSGTVPPDSDTTAGVQHKAEIVVVDLDTIDLSNLNRQFLFRKHHIKKSKAAVAKETASQFNPAASIDAQHGSIFDDKYTVEFFETFDVVFNALDNMEARRHVNRMCLAANVPLLETGTTGYLGHSQPIRKGRTECYDCTDKPVPKTFPTCTIRSTPSQPIHCIVWAKGYLLPELFGTPEDSSDVQVTESDDAAEVAKLREEAEALNKMRSLMGTNTFAEAVFNKVFYDDIERLKSMTEMWRTRKAPESLRFQDLQLADAIKQGQALAAKDQAVWTLLENLAVFCHSLQALSDRVQAGEKVIDFDKDDKDTLDFVASAANIRAHIFNFPLISEWQIKQMAGNIIPAIATSNAMVASLCVLQAFKVIRAEPPKANAMAKPTANNSLPTAVGHADGPPLGGAKMIYLSPKNVETTLGAGPLQPPNKYCPVCSPLYAKLVLPGDGTATLQQLVGLLKTQFKYEELSITLGGVLVYDPDFDDNVEKTLQDLGVKMQGNQFITVADENDEKVDLMLSVSSHIAGAVADPSNGHATDATLRIIPDHIEFPTKPPKQKEEGTKEQGTNGDAMDHGTLTVGTKRKRSAEQDDESASKKAKTNDGVIAIDDDDNDGISVSKKADQGNAAHASEEDGVIALD